MSADWVADAVVYQLDIGQFTHSDGQPGDLDALTARLDHVAALGATCVWLQPFYESPFDDGGYDITDHLAVDPRYGDLAAFDRFMARARELDLRVIVELVAQHTSLAHPWFRSARSDPRSPYRDWYVWSDDPEHDPETRESIFPGVEDSVWTRDEAAGRWYRHLFYAHEPDLDHANPEVVDAIERIARFWLARGVSGFRVDAAPYIVDRARLREGADDGFWALRRLRDVVADAGDDAVLMGEVDVDPDRYGPYFEAGLGLLLDFWTDNHFWLAMARREAAPLGAGLAQRPPPPADHAYACFLRNHDELDLERLTDEERGEVLDVFAPDPGMRIYGRGIRRRLGSMLGDDPDRIVLAHAVQLGLPGVPVLLYGDEVGQPDDLDRPERSAVRTPMAWDRVEAGYPSLEPVRALVRARRRTEELARGETRVLDTGAAPLLAVEHSCPGSVVVTLANLSAEPVSVPRATLGATGRSEEIWADRHYPEDPDVVHVGGHGHRWLRLDPRRHA